MALLQLRDRLSPFRLFDEIRRDMDTLQERLFNDGSLLDNGNGGSNKGAAVLRPAFQSFGATDIYEQDGHLIYETELPGVKKNDISVQAKENRLIVTGEIKRNDSIDEQNYFRMGRHYGRFQRTFLLPEKHVSDLENIDASFRDGILRISVPLQESLKGPEPIEISVN